ncbi:zinc-finger domain-containing protein [Wolbachia endosymbiont of Chironomus riparius]|uniref:zinc-finger domain-containing protein n=1 Tax=Wolbachia endosymbiont of Chironomus riparius TaxID=2883238 RepID=UPI00209EF7C9|nr:zinc-finger domain-containing protein [Wolbachia endosymbiont of Chironomus riparius]
MNTLSEVKVKNKQVCCHGDEDDISSGHPMIYLDMGEEIEDIACPYCGKMFIYECTVELVNTEKNKKET